MSNELEAIVREDFDLDSEHIRVTPFGVEIEGSPSLEEWKKALLKFTAMNGIIQWFLGDLMVYGESPTTGWGQSKYEDLMKDTPYSYKTLREYASIARRFPLTFRQAILTDENVSIRMDTFKVTFGHFQIVRTLPDEVVTHYLNMVKEKRWTVAKLRDEVEAYKDRHVIDADEDEDENQETIPTFNQVVKEMGTWAKNYAKDNRADLIRIQVIKGGHVIEEKTTEVY